MSLVIPSLPGFQPCVQSTPRTPSSPSVKSNLFMTHRITYEAIALRSGKFFMTQTSHVNEICYREMCAISGVHTGCETRMNGLKSSTELGY